MLLVGLCASAQYPGQIKSDKDKEKETPSLRAIAVLEWTGDLGKPKTSRLVPITIYDGEQLQDAGEYLARPEPLAVAGGVEYILQRNGDKIGLFDVKNSGQEQGSWVGFGSWKPLPKPKAPPPAFAQKIDEDVETSDKPVLHRKRGSGGDSSGGGSGSASGKDGSGSGGSGSSAPDPDRPTLHKKSSDNGSGSDNSDSTASAPAADPDRPTLHKAPNSGDSSGQSPTSQSPSADSKASTPASTTSSTTPSTAGDPDRPQLKRGKAKQAPDEGYVESVNAIDPNRPRLTRGKTDDAGPDIAPTLMGLPADMEQAVAVSDPRNHPDHPWSYAWANPDDEAKMKAAVEDLARNALGIQTPQAVPVLKKTTTSRAKAKAAPPPAPAPLMDEEFRVLELAYGSGATMVLTAHTDEPLAQQKFVTLIAQPDLYGSVVLVFKSVTDGAHLDDKPYMRLVDAVDALADNRGELLFELRGKTGRQFALYRVLRGTATQLFVTGGGAASL